MSTNLNTTTQAAPALALPLPAPSAASISISTELLAYLAPLFPSVASMARTEAGAAAWIASWASQIETERITPARLAGALTLLGQLDPSVPLSWPRFAELVRQHRFIKPVLEGDDDDEYRKRRMREFQARYPGARFTNPCPPGAAGSQ